jgi:transcriptional regulator with XRE-family HTH domain
MPTADDDIGIGSRVRAARQRRNWSREALAFHAGISWSAIRQLEAGRRRNLRPGTLAALAGALGVTVDYLVCGAAVSADMLEHRVLLYDTEDEFVATAVPFLATAAERSEAALAVTTGAHCELLREHLPDGGREVEFADQSSWCDTPGGAITRLRTFIDGHLTAGRPWVRILVEVVPMGRPAGEAPLWMRYESMLNLVFAATPLTALCAYDASELDPEAIDQLLLAHPYTLDEAREPVVNGSYLDPVEFVLKAADTAPQTSVNR